MRIINALIDAFAFNQIENVKTLIDTERRIILVKSLYLAKEKIMIADWLFKIYDNQMENDDFIALFDVACYTNNSELIKSIYNHANFNVNNLELSKSKSHVYGILFTINKYCNMDNLKLLYELADGKISYVDEFFENLIQFERTNEYIKLYEYLCSKNAYMNDEEKFNVCGNMCCACKYGNHKIVKYIHELNKKKYSKINITDHGTLSDVERDNITFSIISLLSAYKTYFITLCENGHKKIAQWLFNLRYVKNFKPFPGYFGLGFCETTDSIDKIFISVCEKDQLHIVKWLIRFFKCMGINILDHVKIDHVYFNNL